MDVRLDPPLDPAGPGDVCAAPRRADQWRVLCLVFVERAWARLLAGIDPGADYRGCAGHCDRAPPAPPYLRPRPPLRSAVDLWSRADHRGGLPPAIRLLRSALCNSARIAGRATSR